LTPRSACLSVGAKPRVGVRTERASQTAFIDGALAVTPTASGSVSKPRVAGSHPSSLCRQSPCPVERAKPRA
jgi:hypothetical protein